MTDRPEGKPIEHIGRIIRAEIRTKATPQQAYDAWADPEKIAHLVNPGKLVSEEYFTRKDAPEVVSVEAKKR